MHSAVISDTSCLIVLTNINELQLLWQLYDTVITTSEVAAEYGTPLPDWFKIIDPDDKDTQKGLEYELDRGEASAITLAIQLHNVTIILDDYKARKIAMRLGLDITGTIGVMVKAKKMGIIPSIKPILTKLKATNFRLSSELEQLAIKEAGE